MQGIPDIFGHQIRAEICGNMVILLPGKALPDLFKYCGNGNMRTLPSPGTIAITIRVPKNYLLLNVDLYMVYISSPSKYRVIELYMQAVSN